MKTLCVITFSLILVSGLGMQTDAFAEKVPDWVKNTAKWYGEGRISESEFLNAIRYLINNGVISLEKETKIIRPDPADTKEELIEFGADLLEENNNLAALEFFDKALEKDPNDIKAMINKGIVLARQGNFEGAKIIFDKAIKQSESSGSLDYRAVVNAGIVMSIYGDPNKAIEYFDRALANEEKLRTETHLAALINKGKTLFDKGQYEEAIPFFDKALEIEPNRIGALVNKANALQELNRLDEAYDLFKKAYKLSDDPLSWKPKFVIVHALVGLK